MKAVGLLIAFLALASSPVFSGAGSSADPAALQVSVVTHLGEPIFGAEVIIQPITSADGAKLCFASSFAGRRTLSPAADNFFSGKVNPGTYRMEIRAEGRQTGKVKKVVVGAGEERVGDRSGAGSPHRRPDSGPEERPSAFGEKKEIGEVALESMTSAEIEERARAVRTIPSL